MTAACAACGYQASAVVVASWPVFVALDSKSMNRHVVNAGSSRYAYAKERDCWTLLLRNACRMASVTDAVGFRRVTITRCYYGRQQERDYDNFVGGMKSVLDALVACRVLVDDSRGLVQAIYKQQRSQPTGLRFLIEELAP